MKKLFSFFSMLVLIVLSVGCSDNEDKFETYYEPYGQVEQLELVNKHGTLYYGYGISDKWVISTQDILIENTSVDDGPHILLVIDELPQKYETLKSQFILFSGTIKYLYTKVKKGLRPIVYYSLKLKDLTEDYSSRSIQVETECATTFTAPPAWYYNNLSSRSTNRKAYTFDVFVHVIRSSLGVGDYNKETVSQNVINKLNIGFASANIDFNLIGNSYINSDNYYYFTTSKADALFSENPHDNAIDIYVLSNKNCWPDASGLSKGLFSTACVVKHNSHNTSTIVHEVGHCLGLYHTHHGTVTEIGSDDEQCREKVDGSNSDTCGDYVTDTPADPLSWSIFDECSYYEIGLKDENGDSYNPDPTNFMSYADAGCRTRFTEGQIDKMHLAIENSIDLQGALHGELIGDKNFCSNGIYSIEGLANNETANWTVTKYYPSSTADDQPLSSQTTTYSGSSITLNASNQSAYYVIQATINGTTTLTKTVTSYVPSPYVGTLAWETTDGQFGVTTNMEHGNTLYVSGTKTLSFEYLDQGGNTEANFTCITAANRYLSGSTITLQTSDCTRDLKIRTSNSCGTSGNFFTIPCEVTSYSYNLNLNNSTLSIDVEETAKASLASALSIRESDIKTSGDIQSIKVRNADGQVIFTKNYSVATKGVRINTSSWLPGEYILEITNGDMTQKRKIRVK